MYKISPQVHRFNRVLTAMPTVTACTLGPICSVFGGSEGIGSIKPYFRYNLKYLEISKIYLDMLPRNN
jgi:hypothetical protein